MSNNDSKIKGLMEKVETQTVELGKKPRFAALTNAKFDFDDNRYFNMNVEGNPMVYVEALSFLLMKLEFSKRSCEILGIPYEGFQWNGYSVEDWQSDFKQRIEIINWNLRKGQLNSTQHKLDSLLSTEGKTADILADIEGLLG